MKISKDTSLEGQYCSIDPDNHLGFIILVLKILFSTI